MDERRFYKSLDKYNYFVHRWVQYVFDIDTPALLCRG